MKTTTTLRSFGILIAALGLAITGHGQSFLTNGLIAYYPFNGSANDASGNSNNGTVQNAVLTNNQFGVNGQAYEFNGGAYISAPNRPYLSFPNNGDFTISVWAAVDAEPGSAMIFAGLDNGSGANEKWFFFYGQPYIPTPPAGNYVGFHITDSAGVGYWLAPAPASPTIGSWHQYLVTKAGTSYNTFIDGVLASNGTNYVNYAFGLQSNSIVGPGGIPSGITAPLTIGKSEDLSFNGKLDDLRIYDRALSPSEVQQLYLLEAPTIVEIRKAVYIDSPNLKLGTNYQLQVSTDFTTWTNYGASFTATNAVWRTTNYWDVDGWNRLFFRLQVSP